MSSRRVLILLEHLPEDSAFKTATREGDWTFQAHLTTGMWNEVKAMRGDLWAFLGHERLAFKPVLPPSAVREQETKRSQSRAAHDEVMAQLRGQNQSDGQQAAADSGQAVPDQIERQNQLKRDYGADQDVARSNLHSAH